MDHHKINPPPFQLAVHSAAVLIDLERGGPFVEMKIDPGTTIKNVTFVRILKNEGTRKVVAELRCVCGNIFEGNAYDFKYGDISSCGCMRNKERITHGATKTPEYRIWASMKGRCCNPTDQRYADYGARGITLCERWMKFENFLEDMGKRPSRELSIDRKENDKGYSKENCRWATIEVQNNNRRPRRWRKKPVSALPDNFAIPFRISPELKVLPLWARLG